MSAALRERPGPALRLPWLRPAIAVVTVALHAAALLLVGVPRPQLPSIDDPIELTIAQAPPAEPPPAPPVEPPAPPPPPPPAPAPPPPPPEPPPPPPPEPPPPVVEPPPPPPPLPDPPKPPPPVAFAPPKKAVDDAPVIAIPPPRPRPPPPKPTRVKPADVTPPKPAPPVQPAQPAPPAAPPPASADTQLKIARAQRTYLQKLFDEIARHHIPVNFTGSVRLAIAIDSAGNITAASVAQPSGNPDWDAAVLHVVRTMHTPGPPPDGHLEGRIRIDAKPD